MKEDDLDLDEYLWLNLVDVVVQLTKDTTQALKDFEDHPTENSHIALDTTQLSVALRTNVQQAFTSLLAATTASSDSRSKNKQVAVTDSESSEFPTGPARLSHKSLKDSSISLATCVLCYQTYCLPTHSSKESSH